MWRTNLKIGLTVLVTLGVYTAISNVIPQVESEVPERVEISADASPRELVSIGEELYHGAGGCEACHGLGTRAPKLVGAIGDRCAERVPELSCKEYLHQSLAEPRAFVVEGFQPIMPDIDAQLTGTQVWALVAYLQSQGGEVTVSSADLASAGQGGAAETGGGSASVGGTASAEEGGAPQLWRDYACITCHQMDGQGGVVAPPVEELRAAGLDPEYVRRSILRPNADTASGYAKDYSQFAGSMPTNFGQRLSDAELATLVDFLSGSGG